MLRLLWLHEAWARAKDAEGRRKVEDRAVRQLWGTPSAFVRGLEVGHGVRVTLDLCAERRTAKATRYFGWGSSCLVDALAAPSWRPYAAPGDVGWLNPDFLRKGVWVDRLMQEGLPGLVLVPATTEQAWFGALHDCRRAWLTTLTGRLAFVPPPRVKPSSPKEGVVLWAVNFPRRVLPRVLVTQEVLEIGRVALELETGRAA